MKTKTGNPAIQNPSVVVVGCVCVFVGSRVTVSFRGTGEGKGFCFSPLTRRHDAGFPWFVSNRHQVKRQCDYGEYKEGVGRGLRGQTLNRHRVNLPQKHTPRMDTHMQEHTCSPEAVAAFFLSASQPKQHDSEINLSLV